MPPINWLNSEIQACFDASCRSDIDLLEIHLAALRNGFNNQSASLTEARLRESKIDISLFMAAMSTEWCSLARPGIRNSASDILEILKKICYDKHIYKCK